jgi:ABC-type dipeptide/oligopeptide/nickel transport system permease component
MSRYIAARLLQLVPVLLIISVIVFAIMRVLPGDPAQLMLAGAEGGAVTPERLAELREQMGLNEPAYIQYLRFLGHALIGDFGNSIRFRSSVSELILDRFGSTLSLAIVGLLVAILIGLPLGMIAAVRQNSWIDALSMALAYIGASMPVYWLGLLLILGFSFNLGWFPPAGGGLHGLVLPSLTLGLVSAGIISRLIRSSLIEVLEEDYIRTGRAKGLSEHVLLWRHGLNNALIPVITMAGLQFGAMLAGAVVTETVFSRPGVGRLVVSAILWKDYPLVQGCVLFMAVAYLLVNLLVDIGYAWLDPRIRYRS